jgi:UDP-N-acetylglucosamine--N-acetylmuramyl-(pentapeptide) pyrophosphoryl-undecaprenol N-acetylglucosamine transferase
VFPALAIADAYRRLVPGVAVVFLGPGDGFEARLVPARGHRLALVRAAPLVQVGPVARVRALVATARGTWQARRVLRRERAELVLGLGNYACAPAIVAARTLGVPAVLHEANVVPGLANRLLGRLVDRVLLGFATTAAAFAVPTTVTGTPIETEMAAAPRTAPATPFRIVVVGGSGGSRFLDEHVPDLVARVAGRGHAVDVWHRVVPGMSGAVAAAYARTGVPATVMGFVDDMAATWAEADFAIVSAGAVTLAELAAAGVPALVVPLANAALDHQVANARAFAEATGAYWTRERDWDAAALAALVAALIASPAAWAAASAGVRRVAAPDSANAVVRACETVLAARQASGPRRDAR